jgi:hypothetical protein
MGDLQVNYEALQKIARDYWPEPKQSERQKSVNEGMDPFTEYQGTTVAISNPTKYDWQGFRLMLSPRTDANVLVRVMFNDMASNGSAYGQGIVMRPGDEIVAPRKFDRVWLQNVGSPGTWTFIVSQDYSTYYIPFAGSGI